MQLSSVKFYLLLLSGMLLSACHTTQAPQPPVQVSEQSHLTTLGLDAADIQQLADGLVSSILEDARLELSGARVMALGPVLTRDCPYRIDVRTLQEKLQARLNSSGKLRCSFAVDALKDADAAHARYQVMLLQFEQDQAVNAQDLMTFGKLAKVDYLLFGRVSALTTRKGADTEITYTFNWKLGDCKSGLLEWNAEKEWSKLGKSPRRPLWIDQSKMDDSAYRYRLGQAQGQGSPAAAREAAYADALQQLLQQIDSSLGEEVGLRGAEIIPAGLHLERSGNRHHAWVQVGLPLAEEDALRTRIAEGKAWRDAWEQARSDFHAGEFARSEVALRKLLAEVQPRPGSDLDPQALRLQLADSLRAQRKFPEARMLYEQAIQLATAHSPAARRGREQLEGLPEPPRFWPLRDRFNGGPLALSCHVDEGLGEKPFPELTRILTQDAREVGLEIQERGARAALRVSVIIDPALRGKTDPVAKKQFGVDKLMIDTRVQYQVAHPASGRIVHEGSFKYSLGNQPPSAIAGRLATTLITKYLLPDCPRVE